nr:MAG TPA: hypothetical protein [Caudoviricetes sp.]
MLLLATRRTKELPLDELRKAVQRQKGRYLAQEKCRIQKCLGLYPAFIHGLVPVEFTGY